MILFSISHISGLSTAIALRYTKYKNEKCILLLVNSSPDHYNKNLEINNVFDKVISQTNPKLDKNLSNYKKNIIEHFDKLLKNNDIQLDMFQERISCADVTNLFALYCCYKKNSYSLFEMAPSQFNPRRYYWFDWNEPLKELQIQEKSLLGENKYCINRYLYPNGTLSIGEKDIFINFYDLMYDISNHDKLNVLKSFEIETLYFENLVLLTSDGWTSLQTKLDREETFYPYKVMIDLVFDDNEEVVIKPHPGGKNDGYKEIFTNNKVIDSKIPLEFFAYQKNFKIKKAVSASKSTFNKVSNFIDEKILISVPFLQNHHILLKLYTQCSIFKQLSYGDNFNVLNLDLSILDLFYNDAVDFKSSSYTQKNTKKINEFVIEENNYNIIGDISEIDNKKILKKLLNAPNNAIISFLDTTNFLTYDDELIKEIFNYCVPIEINKEQKSENVFCDLNREIFYIYCKNSKIRNQIIEFNLTHKFKCTGVETTSRAISHQEKQLHFENILLQSNQIKLQKKVDILENRNNDEELKKIKKISDEIVVFDKSINDIKLEYEKQLNKLTIENQKNTTKIQNLENKLNEKIDEISKEKLKEHNKINGQLRWARSELDKIRNSNSYRLGRMLTWLPRKIMSLFK